MSKLESPAVRPTRPREAGEDPWSSTAALLRAAAGGDQTSWDELVRKFGPLVLSTARRHGLSEEECEEVFQATWLALHEQLPRIESLRTIGAWLRVTVRRQIWHLRKREERERWHATESWATKDRRSAEPDARIESRELHHALHAELARLQPGCQALLSLMFFERGERNYDELAVELGMARGSLGPARRRCLAALAERLAGHGRAADWLELSTRLAAHETGERGEQE